MNSNEEKVRTAIAEQAGEWFVASDEGPLEERDSADLVTWLKASPLHVEEFLGVSVIARDLKQARTDPEYSLEAVLARARAAADTPVQHFWPRVIGAALVTPSRRWLPAAVTMAACAVLSLGLFSWWNLRPTSHVPVPGGTTALHFETRHGEQLSRRLADNSVLHLDTDSAVTIQYGANERLVTLTSGQAVFEVAHEPNRAFRVVTKSAEVVDLGTKFDVRLEDDATLVTVVEGRVGVGPIPALARPGTSSNSGRPRGFVQLSANQQVRVAEGAWPATSVAVDAQRTTAWLRGEIVFDNEPLANVAAEFNRYAPKPVEVATPALRNLQISGVFATDDTEAFIAFLHSLKGVRVEVSATQIRVSQD
ncbi:MAG TPA: FecR domain-containing protein [Steroidobacteraceae bacterium]|jgi:transmembrane sensor|nr:FecR domain-containing protein [Steroidobacteraceae bacterium]